MSARTYAVIFLLLIAFALPTIIIALTPYGNLPEEDNRYWTIVIVIYLVNTSLLILVWINNKTAEISFWKGLCLICSQMMSGWANATLLYIFPMLFIAYFILVKGKEYIQMKWIKLVDWF